MALIVKRAERDRINRLTDERETLILKKKKKCPTTEEQDMQDIRRYPKKGKVARVYR